MNSSDFEVGARFTTGDVVATESKVEVFEEMLARYAKQYFDIFPASDFMVHCWIDEWRNRYDSADRYNSPESKGIE